MICSMTPTDQDDPADCILPDDYVVEPYEGHVTTANARELFGWRPGSGERGRSRPTPGTAGLR